MEAGEGILYNYAGHVPYDRQREFLLQNLPSITLHATVNDLRDWQSRLETLNWYLKFLHEAQYTNGSAEDHHKARLSTRQKKEICLQKVDPMVARFVREENEDIFNTEDHAFQSMVEQGQLAVQEERSRTRQNSE